MFFTGDSILRRTPAPPGHNPQQSYPERPGKTVQTLREQTDSGIPASCKSEHDGRDGELEDTLTDFLVIDDTLATLVTFELKALLFPTVLPPHPSDDSG